MGRQIRIIDGAKQVLQVVSDEDPLIIVSRLGYTIGEHDIVRWRETQPGDSSSTVPTLEIERANDYHLNINGRVSSRQARGDICRRHPR